MRPSSPTLPPCVPLPLPLRPRLKATVSPELNRDRTQSLEALDNIDERELRALQDQLVAIVGADAL